MCAHEMVYVLKITGFVQPLDKISKETTVEESLCPRQVSGAENMWRGFAYRQLPRTCPSMSG